jgi:RNA recognition motif-containing protein
MNDVANFVKEHEKDMKESKLKEAYDDFIFKNKVKLEDDFFAKNDFRTTVRGLKVRGVYASRAEAEARSKKLQRNDPIHNIFLGEIGKWLPWDPEPTDVTEQEYAEDQLNTLMKKYKENEEAREMFMRENRNRMRGGANMTTSRPTEAEAAAGGEFGGMFSGPADLAIARKTEKSSE